MPDSIHSLTVHRLDGTSLPLSEYEGKVLLVVNVASACGLTPQYTGLQKLHTELSGRGFAVLGFPCNQFGLQEPGSAEEIQEFCSTRYRVTFPMFEKVEVKPGPGQSPVYAILTASGHVPGWNFAKYLVGPDGKVIRFFASQTDPADPALRQAIEVALME
jgi:glutathione peroxidase